MKKLNIVDVRLIWYHRVCLHIQSWKINLNFCSTFISSKFYEILRKKLLVTAPEIRIWGQLMWIREANICLNLISYVKRTDKLPILNLQAIHVSEGNTIIIWANPFRITGHFEAIWGPSSKRIIKPRFGTSFSWTKVTFGGSPLWYCLQKW